MLIIFTMLNVGCVTKRAEFAIVGTKNVNLSMQEFEKIEENATGESAGGILLIFPLKLAAINEAVQDALRKHDGEFMTDAVVYYKYFTIPALYTWFAYQVKGSVWRLKDRSGVDSR